jgi:hypothetical protein
VVFSHCLLLAPRVDAQLVNWLVISVVASVALTILLNVALRVVGGSGGGRTSRRSESWRAADEQLQPNGGRTHRTKVFFPWKTALIASLVLTILLNVAIRVS